MIPKDFSLIELILIIAIVAILSTVFYRGYSENHQNQTFEVAYSSIAANLTPSFNLISHTPIKTCYKKNHSQVFYGINTIKYCIKEYVDSSDNEQILLFRNLNFHKVNLNPYPL